MALSPTKCATRLWKSLLLGEGAKGFQNWSLAIWRGTATEGDGAKRAVHESNRGKVRIRKHAHPLGEVHLSEENRPSSQREVLQLGRHAEEGGEGIGHTEEAGS